MIGNLVDNAVRYNRAGGRLVVGAGTADGRAVLRISNTGREIPPGKAETLLEPFVHGQGTRVRTDGLGLGLSIVRGQGTRVRTDGLGLGLSIVCAVALAHRGRVAVAARAGGGLDVTVDLPRSPAVAIDILTPGHY